MMRTILLATCLLVSACRAGDADTVTALEQAGGKFTRDKDGAVTSVFFKDSSAITTDQWKQIGSLATLKKGTFYNKCTLNDETLPLLKDLQNLEEFAVDGAHLTDKGMAAFGAWKSLKKMTFFHVFWGQQNFNGTGLSVFAELPHLEAFAMGGSTLTDAGLESIGKIAQLKDLHLWHTGITNAGTAHLKNLTHLSKLNLAPQFNPRLSDPMLENIAALSTLEKLTLGETRLSEEGLKKLKSLASLKELELEHVDISDADMEKLKADLPNVAIKLTRPTDKEMENLNRNFAEKK